mmetsp:Transcript_13547/g.34065  ORF Transcript_13547/g.34065 Transcript_13547/m.34065 type:complete len:295 (+) Transcript_13547:231-1115(+)
MSCCSFHIRLFHDELPPSAPPPARLFVMFCVLVVVFLQSLPACLGVDEWHGIGVQDVVHEWVGEVIDPAVDGALPGAQVLQPEPDKGEHGEPAVLDLLQLELLQVLPAVPRGPAKWVEDAAWVARLGSLGERVLLEDGVLGHAAFLLHVLVPPDLHPVHQEELDDEVDLGVGVVLEGGGVDPVHARAWPVEAGLGEDLRDEDANDAQHGEARVQELRLHEPLELLGLRAQLQRIETEVAGKALQVLRGLLARVPVRGLAGSAHNISAALNNRRFLQGGSGGAGGRKLREGLHGD